MKLFKRNLTSRFAHSATSQGAPIIQTEGHYNIRRADVLATCAAGLIINRNFHPGARCAGLQPVERLQKKLMMCRQLDDCKNSSSLAEHGARLSCLRAARLFQAICCRK